MIKDTNVWKHLDLINLFLSSKIGCLQFPKCIFLAQEKRSDHVLDKWRDILNQRTDSDGHGLSYLYTICVLLWRNRFLKKIKLNFMAYIDQR